jgi:hypothetical protein
MQHLAAHLPLAGSQPTPVPTFEEYLAATGAGVMDPQSPFGTAQPHSQPIPSWVWVSTSVLGGGFLLLGLIVMALLGRGRDEGSLDLAKTLVEADRGNVAITCVSFSCPAIGVPGASPQDSGVPVQAMSNRATPVSYGQPSQTAIDERSMIVLSDGNGTEITLAGGLTTVTSDQGRVFEVRLSPTPNAEAVFVQVLREVQRPDRSDTQAVAYRR